jgi:hypothetical protein
MTRGLNSESDDQREEIGEAQVSAEKKNGFELTSPSPSLRIIFSEKHEDAMSKVCSIR